MDIQYAVHKFGAYFFKPVTARTLHAVGIPDDVIAELGADLDSGKPLYLMGLAANEWSLRNRAYDSSYLSALDDFSHPTGYEFSKTTSLLWSLGEHYESDGLNIAVKRDSIGLLEKLITSVGVAESFKRTEPGHVPLQMLEIRARLVALKSAACGPVDCLPSEAPAAENPTPVAPQESQGGVPRLSRKEVLELLQTERECVIRAETCDRDCSKCPLVRDSRKLIVMYDTVIRSYKRDLRQNSKGKYVCMADGSRKWVSAEKAAELLALPRGERK